MKDGPVFPARRNCAWREVDGVKKPKPIELVIRKGEAEMPVPRRGKASRQ